MKKTILNTLNKQTFSIGSLESWISSNLRLRDFYHIFHKQWFKIGLYITIIIFVVVIIDVEITFFLSIFHFDLTNHVEVPLPFEKKRTIQSD